MWDLALAPFPLLVISTGVEKSLTFVFLASLATARDVSFFGCASLRSE
jgi:hypothetical protein